MGVGRQVIEHNMLNAFYVWPMVEMVSLRVQENWKFLNEKITACFSYSF
uniref:Uncharacterized protein n=1 Tax=Ciona intestinalis TaxID=7719 RepID=H2Y267_CIOIN